ncbi:MJ0042 family finger-like domain-containing protein [Acinetobacter boissieri]|uniref:MJ0042 family finger-like domain-containing protein n=2 Tax=Acinetobacter boissieri TaxID=1219383 RepID=A0A1G6IFB6_9GAMM|nr:MJ0042 family finger-like domain-containing protein [Acinetobacter boissieri]
MQSITSTCPACKTKYRVSVLQLRVAQGKVCCFKCSNTFNAYLCMSNKYKPQQIHNAPLLSSATVHQSKQTNHPILEIFESKSNSSNIDLRTYLNNTHYIHPQHDTPKLQHTLRLYPRKGQYRPKKTSFPLLIIAIFCFISLGLLILIVLAYTLIGIG